MMLLQRKNFFTPPQFNLASAGCLGTTQRFALDRTFPIEEILLHIDVTNGATGPTPRIGASSSGQPGLDALLGIIKRVNLSVNDGIQPRSVVDFSGIGLLEYAQKVGLNWDAATTEAVRLWQISIQLAAATAYANSNTWRYTIRIPMVHPLIAEPLRTRMLLPVHTFPADPILTIDFESGTNMYSAGSVSALAVTVDLIRRDMSAAVTAEILKSGGFIRADLLEAPVTIGTGISGEQRFPINTPGSYMNLLFRQYLGGATMTRDVLDQTTTFGSESRWRLESGGIVIRDWRWKQLKVINELSMPKPFVIAPGGGLFVAASSAGAVTTAFPPCHPPDITGAIPNASAVPSAGDRPAASTLMDFLTDGLDSAAELGSLLDTNLPARTGLKMECIGPVASVATQGSILYIGGHRLFDDLSKWQAIKT